MGEGVVLEGEVQVKFDECRYERGVTVFKLGGVYVSTEDSTVDMNWVMDTFRSREELKDREDLHGLEA